METLRLVIPEAKATGLVIRVRRGADPAGVRQALKEQSNYRLTVSLMRTFIAGGFVRELLDLVNVLSQGALADCPTGRPPCRHQTAK